MLLLWGGNKIEPSTKIKMKKAKASLRFLALSLALFFLFFLALAGLPHTQWLHRFIAVTSDDGDDDDDSRVSLGQLTVGTVGAGTRLGLCALVLVLVFGFLFERRHGRLALPFYDDIVIALFFAHSHSHSHSVSFSFSFLAGCVQCVD